MNLEQAKAITTEFINNGYKNRGDVLVILDEETIEKEYGWYFSYNSRRFLETGKLEDMVAGNAPVLVEKENGNVTQLGTAYPIEFYIELYEKGKL